MSENKKRIIIIAAVAAVCVGLYFGGQAVVDHAQAAQQAELDAYQAEQQAQLEAARKAEEEAAAKASTITLAPIPSNNATAAAPTQSGSQETPKPIPSATITTEPDGSITIIPDFEAQAAAASQLQKPGEKVDANMGGGGGDLPLGKDGAYHGDHPAQGSSQETPKPTASTSSPEASTKPSEATQKPTVSQKPNTPAPIPTAAVEPPVASQKPNGDDSGSEDKPEVTPKPSQEPQSGPPSNKGTKDGQISPDGKYIWTAAFGWTEYHPGGIAEEFGTPGETLSGHKVGNM